MEKIEKNSSLPQESEKHKDNTQEIQDDSERVSEPESKLEKSLESLERMRHAAMEKVVDLNSKEAEKFFIHGTQTRARGQGDKFLSHLETILSFGLLTPYFLERAQRSVSSQAAKERLRNTSVQTNPVENPHNKKFVSLLRIGEGSESPAGKNKRFPYTYETTPLRHPSYRLAAGYAGMMGVAYGEEGTMWVGENKESYMFIIDPDLAAKSFQGYKSTKLFKEKYSSSMHNEAEYLRFLRIAPRFLRGIIITDAAEIKNRLPRIVETMIEVFGSHYDLYLPVYDLTGGLLWPKQKTKEREYGEYKDIYTAADFLEKVKHRQDLSFIFLKGGELGGLNPEAKTKILNHLTQWFEITEGEKHKLNFEEIAARWGDAGLQYQFRKMENNPEFKKEFIDEGRGSIINRDESGFKQWMEKAKSISGDDTGFLRQELMMDYFSQEGQLLLLKLKEGVTRKTILEDLGINNRESLVKAVGGQRADLNWLDSSIVNFQNFIKRIIIGETTSYKAAPGTIRSIIAQELKNGALEKTKLRAMELKIKNPKVWQVEPGDYNSPSDDEETIISTFLNAVHTVDFSFGEFELMTDSEIEKFDQALTQPKI